MLAALTPHAAQTGHFGDAFTKLTVDKAKIETNKIYKVVGRIAVNSQADGHVIWVL